jgi:DNA polymerase III epsilon subunit-like protein
MIIASLDLETTGLDAEKDQILEFGCILFDTDSIVPANQMPYFRRGIVWERLSGHPVALDMNSELIHTLSTKNYTIVYDGASSDGYCEITELGSQFFDWLKRIPFGPDAEGRIKLHLAGKNFGGFDQQFLKRVPDFNEYIRLTHRAFDPAVLFFNPAEDMQLPALEQCCVRAGLGSSITHRALGDAQAVIECLRYAWSKRP